MSGTDSSRPGGSAGGRYYREIAGRFLARRGAPLFLSAKDLDLIASWELAAVPLDAVLEGIDRAFEARRGRRSAGDKVLSLSFCAPQVLKAFERVRDRRVGAPLAAAASRPDRRAAVRAAVEAFLGEIPAALDPLKKLFQEALGRLDGAGLSDEDAEALDKKVDAFLVETAAPADRAAARAEVRAEHRSLPAGEAARSADVRLARRRREVFKVPYLSVYYY
jgi:hypothetical protein